MERTRKIERLIEDIRKTPIFRQLIPMEAQIGWPIPLRRESKVYVTLVFFGANSRSKGETVLFPPFAKITLDWSNQIPVEYVNLRFQNPWKEGNWEAEVGIFPHSAIAQITVAEYQKKRQELLAMYDEMLDKLAQGGSFLPDWKTRFKELLRLLMEPPLEPYYRAIDAKFFDHFLPHY
ncbi:hypothetical protein IQ264_01310 [Phormidium sp. LEGE 05292]|uniref:hypothetical protein n=1 Tax=[Phormidium] sp. LEGE 05292 TaxID=767427 RepID=UPI0018823CA9|nr:hypothetical protein [Phormidium sp. LEGE 05292]MBE9224111.1 hypothetical protein [Phormidium sp. LEGE 05292]